ncbi:carbohydrate ABC transporter permease [Oceanispirochaeta sp.]|uniref:carbohydrate ABC transporter permease n=1 Tax=Oceanispirochaeta sp. TaxID=2035350 RepID=UPI002606C8D2|nr:carbohydrate ABC transporter permease [Oceanispirochaeta sp.]MDA3957590.1 carbohydrate ABC transporter permease [Oceanispirochaeta sp.]
MAAILFGIPFYFVINNASKNSQEASLMNIKAPAEFLLYQNIAEVLSTNKGIVLIAFKNSFLITIFSILVLIVSCSMAGFVSQRRTDKATPVINFLILAGLIIPPAIVPTIWLLMSLNIFKTMFSMVMIEAALTMSFSTLLYKGFTATIPRQIDEAAIVDGAGPVRLFFQIIFPLLKPTTATVIVLSSVNIFNDFVNPLYFFPGAKNATVQLTLYNFMSKFHSSWQLLFADVLIISIPPLILFIFFNRKIIAGMSAGAIKG